MKQPEALRLASVLTNYSVTTNTEKQAADELRRLHEAFEMNARTIAMYEHEQLDDEALLRQALDTMAYWLEHGETPGAHDMIQRTHDALQERLK